MRVLLVDDEKPIRAGLAKIIREHFDAAMEVLEAPHGEAAREVLEKEPVDVVITDIKMPRMDGVALMEYIKGHPELERPAIIVLSGYDDFTYARAAIGAGASAYLLKPVDKQELIQTIEQALEKIHHRKKLMLEQNLQHFAYWNHVNPPLKGQSSQLGRPYRIAGIRFNEREQVESLEDLKKLVYIIEEKRYALFCLIYEQDWEKVKNILARCSLQVGYGNVYTYLTAASRALEEARIACLATYLSKEAVVGYHHEFSDSEDTDGRSLERGEPLYEQGERKLSENFERLVYQIGSGDTVSLLREIQRIFDPPLTQGDEKKGVWLWGLHKLLHDRVGDPFKQTLYQDPYLYAKHLCLQEIFNYFSFEEYKKDWQDLLLYLDIQLAEKRHPYPFIQEALVYIHRHFTEPINMTVVANHVSVNYTYFSEVFKQVMGINFNEYLKNLRLSHAKELLRKGCYRVYEVAERSGFGDVKYFMKTFKESVGLSPGEYQKYHATWQQCEEETS
ncbi:MAG TPA: response regulator [Termitinemataceae bacterium]|nr:response regulator [Termitinemataceae bacterium]HPQ01364.1 response regulator [Termitinemataceae bacterium]